MKSNKKNVILISSFKKYGFDNHLFQIIVECDNQHLDELEIYYIKYYNSYYLDNPMGMNMTTGGTGQSGHVNGDDEKKERLLKNLYSKGYTPFLGKHHTEENKKAASERVKKYNKEHGIKVPKWGAEKGWESVRKKILCYGEDGNFLCQYNSLTEAAKSLGVKRNNITDSLLKNRWVFGKYKFKYYSENYLLKIPNDDIRFKNDKRAVLVFDKKMNFLGEYESSMGACIDFKIPKTTINRAAEYNNLRPIRKGYIFAYKDKYGYLLNK